MDDFTKEDLEVVRMAAIAWGATFVVKDNDDAPAVAMINALFAHQATHLNAIADKIAQRIK